MNLLWLYDLPDPFFGLTVVLSSLAFGIGGLFVTRKWVASLHSPHSQNDIVSFYFAATGVFYGITLGLLAVGTWATFSDTESKVQQEAGTLGGLYRDISSYPEPARAVLQEDLKKYVREVIDVSWPLQSKGIVPNGGALLMDAFQRQLAAFEPVTEGQKVLHMSAMDTYNRMIEFRRARLQAVSAGLSGTLWLVVVLGGMLTLAASWFFQTGTFSMHFWMTTILSALMGLEMYLIAAMDHPLRGSISVSPQAFELIYRQLMAR
jgi:predicted ribosomally synthesized peptide with SipW-like signal peptide